VFRLRLLLLSRVRKQTTKKKQLFAETDFSSFLWENKRFIWNEFDKRRRNESKGILGRNGL
jgi:hypothetical protein